MGCGKEILGAGGLGEAVLLAYSDKDYEKGIDRFRYLLEKVDKIEKSVDNKYKNASQAKKALIKRNLRGYAAKFRNVSNKDNFINLSAKKYNKEHFGVETFEELLTLFENTDDNKLVEQRNVRKQNIDELAKYNGGVLTPIMPFLVSNNNVMRRLLANDSLDENYAQDLVDKFAPLINALQKNDQPAFIVDQYLNNNFDDLYEQCMKKPLVVKEWTKALDEYANTLYKTEIQGRGTIQGLIDDAIKYAEYKEKA